MKLHLQRFDALTVTPADHRIPGFLRDVERGRCYRDRLGRIFTGVAGLYLEITGYGSNRALVLYYDKMKLGVVIDSDDDGSVDIDVDSW